MKFTIYGNPVEHSKSPQMHNAGFEELNFDGFYTKTLLEDGNNLKENFLKNNIQGANITVPHKEKAFMQADEIVGIASKIGAVNTYINENGKIKAYNTDAPGFMRAIEEFGDIKDVLLLGAGGTAKAISVALRDKNIDVTVVNRSINKKDFFENLNCKFYDYNGIEKVIETNNESLKYDLIINSTSAGLKDKNYPAPLNILTKLIINSKNAIDCIYGKMTPFLQEASKNGLKYKDGEDMLLYQGIIAFELFTNVNADKKVVKVMRDGLNNNCK